MIVLRNEDNNRKKMPKRTYWRTKFGKRTFLFTVNPLKMGSLLLEETFDEA